MIRSEYIPVASVTTAVGTVDLAAEQTIHAMLLYGRRNTRRMFTKGDALGMGNTYVRAM